MRVAELTGSQLDSAVALALGMQISPNLQYWDAPADVWGYVSVLVFDWSPSTNWTQGGAIIEKHLIAVSFLGERIGWFAGHCRQPGKGVADGLGPTPLIAAMGAVVAGVYGKEAPDEALTAYDAALSAIKMLTPGFQVR